MKEPVVVNGRLLPPESAIALMEDERGSTTGRPKVEEQQEGVLNTLVIEGVSDLFKEALSTNQIVPKSEASPFMVKSFRKRSRVACTARIQSPTGVLSGHSAAISYAWRFCYAQRIEK